MSVWSVRSLGAGCGVALCLAATSLLAASPSGAVGGMATYPQTGISLSLFSGRLTMTSAILVGIVFCWGRHLHRGV